LSAGLTGNSAASAGPVYADEFAGHFLGRNGSVNALRLSTKIGVERTEDDTCMVCSSVLMKVEKVAAVVGQENSAIRRRERQDFGVRHGGVRFSGIQRGEDIMPQPPQFRDDRQRNIFV